MHLKYHIEKMLQWSFIQLDDFSRRNVLTDHHYLDASLSTYIFLYIFVRRHPFNSLRWYGALKQTNQCSIAATVHIANLNSNLQNIQVHAIQNDLKFCDR